MGEDAARHRYYFPVSTHSILLPKRCENLSRTSAQSHSYLSRNGTAEPWLIPSSLAKVCLLHVQNPEAHVIACQRFPVDCQLLVRGHKYLLLFICLYAYHMHMHIRQHFPTLVYIPYRGSRQGCVCQIEQCSAVYKRYGIPPMEVFE